MATINDYLKALFRDSGIVELRHSPSSGCWQSYWFDNAAALLDQLPTLEGKGNIYTSLNAPKLRKIKNGRQQEPQKNEDVAFRTRIPFDFDPVRQTDNQHCPSSDDELSAAFHKMKALSRYLSALDWQPGLQGMSGNGYHLQQRCHIPVNPETSEAISVIYKDLKAELSDPLVQFDTSVKSPGQIFRLYGTINRKNTESPGRPFRRASVWIPPNWQQVTRKQIDSLANYFARTNTATKKPCNSHKTISGSGDYASLDIVAWFSAHGLYQHHIQENMHDVMCPWEAEHSSSSPGDTVIFEADGKWPGFHCNHGHCVDRKIGDVINLLGDADQFCTQTWRATR